MPSDVVVEKQNTDLCSTVELLVHELDDVVLEASVFVECDSEGSGIKFLTKDSKSGTMPVSILSMRFSSSSELTTSSESFMISLPIQASTSNIDDAHDFGLEGAFGSLMPLKTLLKILRKLFIRLIIGPTQSSSYRLFRPFRVH